MVNDVLDQTRRRVEASGAGSPADVRAAGQALAGFSAGMAAEERQLKRFLYARMYEAPRLLEIRAEAQRVVAGLFEAYRCDRSLLPPEWRSASEDAVTTARAISDFIAGMTDRYAIARYEELVGPVELPEGF
jgi:dGTPase